MSDIKVSVIIPVYNVEHYLRECLDSVINQTLKEIEIICIDDCSPDNSYKILEEYSRKDSRIIVLKNEKNSGAGTSRNKGINASKGEYIGFIDSDDYISNDYFESLYNTAKKFDSDITNTINIYLDINSDISYYYCNLNKTSKLPIEYESETKIENINILSKDVITYSVWNKIFKKDFLNKNELLFIENKIGSSEDADFIIRVIINNPKMSFNNLGKHYYRKRENSSMNISNSNTKYIISSIKHMINTLNYAKEKNEKLLYPLTIKIWHCPYYLFSISNELNRKNSYKYLHEFAASINIIKDLAILNGGEYLEYNEYLLIKSNDTYEKYLLAKEMFEKINKIDNRINELNNTLNPLIKKLDKKIKIFSIDKFDDKKIIYIFGIKITIKK